MKMMMMIVVDIVTVYDDDTNKQGYRKPIFWRFRPIFSCKIDSICIKPIFFGPKKTDFADHILAQLPGLVKSQIVNGP